MFFNAENEVYVRPHNLKLMTETEKRIKYKARNDTNLENAKQVAKSNGGECLSEEVERASTKLLWKCNHPEHKPWMATYSAIVNSNNWCPHCDYERKFGFVPDEFKQPGLHLGIARANYLASRFNTVCISTEYKNNMTPLLFKCSNPNHLSFKMIGRDLSDTFIGNKKHLCPACRNEEKELENKAIFEAVKMKIESMGGKVITQRFIKKTSGIDIQFGDFKTSLTYKQMLRLINGKALRTFFRIRQ